MKKFLLTVASLLIFHNLFAAPKQVRMGVLNGPSGIPCAYLMENKDSFGIKNLSFESCTSAQTELPKIINGELDVGFLPPNAAAKVFTSGKGALICLGVTGNGNISVISKGEGFYSFEDLKGQNVLCAGQGATPEYMMRYILSKKEIKTGTNEDEVNLDFSVPNANIAAAVISGKAKYAVVPEPFATVACLKDSSVKRIINIQEVFTGLSGIQSYPMTLLVANAKFASSNSDSIKKIIEAVKKSSDWTVKNPVNAGNLTEKHKLGQKADIVKASIPEAAYTWKPATEAKAEIEALLSIFLEASPESIGGKLPAESFYYDAK